MIVKYIEPITGTIVFISSILLDGIHKHILLHYPKEFGGILSGCVHGNSLFVLDMVTPKKYSNSRVEFTRHPDGLNEYLLNIFKNTDGFIEYLGEWHSHPDGNLKFSDHDLKTMSTIAEDKDVKTKRPLLLIVTLINRKMHCALYLSLDKRLLSMKLSETI